MSERPDPSAPVPDESACADVALGDVLANKYKLDRVLGEGGTCTVFAARNLHATKQVALKWLRRGQPHYDELVERLLREGQALSAIDHPSVVTVFDVERHQGAWFLVMELLQGEPLSELLARGPQDSFTLINLMLPVLDGIHAAHQLGFVHRDLKPENLFVALDPSGGPPRLKLFDFGIAKLSETRLAGSRPLTSRGAVFGTPRYMSPEQMRDAQGIDLRADIYALGVILYHALSGRFPYEGDTLGELAAQLVGGPPTPLQRLAPSIPNGLSYLVMRALALAPEDRFSSVQQLALALAPYSRRPSDGLSALAPAKPPPLPQAAIRPREARPPTVSSRAKPPPLPPHIRRASGVGRTR